MRAVRISGREAPGLLDALTKAGGLTFGARILSPDELKTMVADVAKLGIKAVRSVSEFNYSMIALVFEDDVPFYFARERVLEKLSAASTFLLAAALRTGRPARVRAASMRKPMPPPK